MKQPDNYLKTHSDPRAFSLIELLAVIAIIGVLASIIIPVLSNVREKAAERESLSNLRSIGLEIKLYAIENGGKLPSPEWGANDHWLVVLYERVYNQPFDEAEFVADPFSISDTIFWSPTLQRSEPQPWRSYGFNGFLGELATDTSEGEAISLNRIEQPARTVLIGDVLNSSNLFLSTINFRNSGKAHVLYVDNHVSAITPEEVPDNIDDPFWGWQEAP